MAKTKKLSRIAKPEPDAPVIVLRSESIRVIMPGQSVVIDRRTGKVDKLKCA